MTCRRLRAAALWLALVALAPLPVAAQPAQGASAPDEATSEKPPVWVPTFLPWVTANKPLGQLPQTVAVPPKAYAYAVQSAPIEPFGKQQATILRVVISVNAGSVGIFRASADGGAKLSDELVAKTPGVRAVYFRLMPGDPPAIVVIRNYDGEGVTGQVVIQSAAFARELQLNNSELAEAAKNGLY